MTDVEIILAGLPLALKAPTDPDAFLFLLNAVGIILENDCSRDDVLDAIAWDDDTDVGAVAEQIVSLAEGAAQSATYPVPPLGAQSDILVDPFLAGQIVATLPDAMRAKRVIRAQYVAARAEFCRRFLGAHSWVTMSGDASVDLVDPTGRIVATIRHAKRPSMSGWEWWAAFFKGYRPVSAVATDIEEAQAWVLDRVLRYSWLQAMAHELPVGFPLIDPLASLP